MFNSSLMFNRGSPPLLRFSLVSIGVGLEGAGIQDSFVIYQLIPFLLWKGEEFIGVRISDDLIRISNLDFSWIEEGVLDFVEDILTHDVIVELGLALAVESEPSHLAFHLFFIRSITIILGSPLTNSWMYSSASNSEVKSPR